MCKHSDVFSLLILIGRGLNLKQLNLQINISEIHLSSFESMSGDDGEVDPPVPIPNTEVKHFSVDDS